MSKFEQGQNIYYKNKPCVFITKANADEAVIEIYAECNGSDECSGEIPVTIIVPFRYLSETVFDEDKEYIAKLQEVDHNVSKEYAKRKKDVQDELNRLTQEVSLLKEAEKNLKDRLKSIDSLTGFLDYVEGTAKWIVCNLRYKFDIYELDSLKELSSGNPAYLALVIKRDKTDEFNKASFIMNVSWYSDGSGGDYNANAKLFSDFNEAIKYFEDRLVKEETIRFDRSHLEKYNITNPILWDRVKKIEEKEREGKAQYILKLQEELEAKRKELELRKKEMGVL